MKFTEEQEITLEEGIKRMNRLDLASRAPEKEIDGMIGPSVDHASKFLGIDPESYHFQTHYPQCVVKARFMWADAMIKEANK